MTDDVTFFGKRHRHWAEPVYPNRRQGLMGGSIAAAALQRIIAIET